MRITTLLLCFDAAAPRLCLAIVFLAALAQGLEAQFTPQEWINAGRNNLRQQTNVNLELARQSFANAVQREANNGEAIVLEVGTTIALELLRPEFKQELARLGVHIENDSLYGAVFSWPQDEAGNYVPPNGASSDHSRDYANTRLGEVDRLLGLLQRINDPGFLIHLSAQETGTTATRVDYMDVVVLRIILHLAKASLTLANSYNLSGEYSLIYEIVREDKLNPQEVLRRLPELLKFSGLNQRLQARDQLKLANADFQTAVAFYLEQRPHDQSIDYLFDFSNPQEAMDSAAVTQFMAGALDGPQPTPEGLNFNGIDLTAQTLDLAPLFTGADPMRDFLPTRFDRGLFRRDSWPDATLGGVFGEPDTNLLNQLGAGALLVQGAIYRPYEISVLAGSDAPPPWEWPRAAYRPFSDLRGIAVDGRGDIYLADAGFNVIRKLSSNGVMTTIAGVEWTSWEEREQLRGNERIGSGWHSDTSTAVLDAPSAVAVDAVGNVYFSSGRRILKVSANGILSVLAGSPGSWGEAGPFDGVGGNAKFASITSMAADSEGNVYVVDNGTAVRKVTPDGVVTTLAGSVGWGWFGGQYQDGPKDVARFGWIEGSIAVDSQGSVYVADAGNNTIRKIESNGMTSTVLGSPRVSMHYDGARSEARLMWPRGVAIDSEENLFFLDDGTVRQLTRDGLVVTLAGKPGARDSERPGVGENARFSNRWPFQPNWITATPWGGIYVANYRTIHQCIAMEPRGGGGGGSASNDHEGMVGGPPWPTPPDASPRTGSGEVVSLSLPRASIELDGLGGSLPLLGTYSESLSSISVSFVHEQSGTTVWANQSFEHPTAPKNFIGSRPLSLSFELGPNTPSGVWRISSFSWSSPDGSGGYYSGEEIPPDWAALTFTVTNWQPIDSVAPVPVSLEVLPFGINPAFNGWDAASQPRVRLSVDDASKLSYANVTLVNSAGYESNWQTATAYFDSWALVAVDGDLRTYEANLRLPPDATAGGWILQNIFLSDASGNNAWFSREVMPNQLAGTIFTTGDNYAAYVQPADSGLPSVSQVEIVPQSVDVGAGRQSVVIRVHASDDVSGVNGLNVTLATQSDSFSYSGLNAHSFQLVSGSSLEGIFESALLVLPTSSNGEYRVSDINVQDRAGNSRAYSQYTDGSWSFPLTEEMQKTLTVTGGNQVTPPSVITSISASPANISTLASGAEVSWRFTIRGQEPQMHSWSPHGAIGIHSPSGTQYLWSDYGAAHLIEMSGDLRTYEVVFRLPQYSEHGTWALDYIEVKGVDYYTPSSYILVANISAAGLTPPTFAVEGVHLSWQQELVSLQPPKQAVEVVFSDLNFVFDGSEKFADAFVRGPLLLNFISPEGSANNTFIESDWADLRLVFTYNGLTTAPIDEGVYRVVAYVDDAQYSGSASSWMAIVGEDYLKWARALYGTDHEGMLPPEAQPLFDADSDGVPNITEFYLGSDPLDAGSKLSANIAQEEDGILRLTIHPIASAGAYFIQYADSLTGGVWSEPELLDVVSGAGSVRLQIDSGAPRGFFRIIYAPPGGAELSGFSGGSPGPPPSPVPSP